MKHGFLKLAIGTPAIRLADCEYNTERILELVQRAEADGAKVLVLPELCVTGYSCGDLFLQDLLIQHAKKALLTLAEQTAGMGVMLIAGAPVECEGKLYNAAACIRNGKILGIAAKTALPDYAGCAESRYFSVPDTQTELVWNNETIPFGRDLLFCAREFPEFQLGIEICEELWVPDAPAIQLAKAGATIIANPAAGNAVAGMGTVRREKVKSRSATIKAAYLYSNAGMGESTTDMVYSGQGYIAENGELLAEGEPFVTEYLSTEVDLAKLRGERRRMSTWKTDTGACRRVEFSMQELNGGELPEINLTRHISPTPFFPENQEARSVFCREVMEIQSAGLQQRLLHIGVNKLVIGISGGLDSTMALLIAVKTFDRMKLDRNGILAVTMPCFGTTDRTYRNALELVRELGVTLKEIRINDAVTLHLNDIGHDINNKNATYENAQARERTQILMDLANEVNGIVLGTGDLSELALGWATYNGDHMSMYSVNASVPKTLMRHLVGEFARQNAEGKLAATLQDILDTPVSPELLPPEDGKITQKTEELVGPYELHDFFLYYIVQYGFAPTKVYRMAREAFAGCFADETVLAWLKVFCRRFFSQQYKRSCLPDGPKATVVTLSPRTDWHMPSDAHTALWMKELDGLGRTY